MACKIITHLLNREFNGWYLSWRNWFVVLMVCSLSLGISFLTLSVYELHSTPLHPTRTCIKTHGGARAWISSICFQMGELSSNPRGYCFFLYFLLTSYMLHVTVSENVDPQIPFHLVTRLWDTYLAEGDALPDFLVYIFASFLLTVSSHHKLLLYSSSHTYINYIHFCGVFSGQISYRNWSSKKW